MRTLASNILLQMCYIVLPSKIGPNPARPHLCGIVSPTHCNVMQINILVFGFLFQSFFACQHDCKRPQLAAANVVFASQQMPEKKPAAAPSIIVSADGGQTWQDFSAGLPEGLEAGGLFADDKTVFLGCEDGFYRSTAPPMASSWEKDFFMPEKITDVFWGRAGLYACGYGKGIFQKSPGTDSWLPVYNALKDKTVRSILDTPDGSVFVGCDKGIFKSTDGGQTWKQVFDAGIVLNVIASGNTLIACGIQGILRSTDGGEHWDWVLSEGGMGIQTALIEGGIAAITYNVVTETRRIRISADNGTTWRPIDKGLPPSQLVSDIKQVGEHLFCSHPDGIFRSSDRGETWSLVRPSAGNKMFNLTVSGQVIYAVLVAKGC